MSQWQVNVKRIFFVKKNFIYYVYACVFICVSLYAPHACGCPQRKEDVGSHGTGVTRSHELLDASDGYQTQASSARVLDYWIISSALDHWTILSRS